MKKTKLLTRPTAAFGGIVRSPRSILLPVQALELANIYLENACNVNDHNIALTLCHDTEVALSQAKSGSKSTDHHLLRESIANVYIELGRLLDGRGHCKEAQASYKKADKMGAQLQKLDGRLVPYPVSDNNSTLPNGTQASTIKTRNKQGNNNALIPMHIFSDDIRPPLIVNKLPDVDERITDVTQLVCCLGIMQSSLSPDDILEPPAQQWRLTIEKDVFEQDRLKILATDVVRVFQRDEIKDSKAIAEVVYLAQVLGKESYRHLLKELFSGIEKSSMLEYHQLEGVAQLIQSADSGYIDADDLVKILELLSERLRNTHYQSSHHMYRLTTAVSQVLDAMADSSVKDLDREKLHESLTSYVKSLCKSTDPYLMYQAAYAYQALQYVPDDETLWQAAFRRTGKVIRGFSRLVEAVKGIDLNAFIEGLKNIQEGLAGASDAIGIAKTTIDDVKHVMESGGDFVKSLKEGLSFKRKRAWYPALRMANTLLRDGQFTKFRELICSAPCRHDPAFQWGVCQQLGEVASNPIWDNKTRHDAIEFLGVIYQNDAALGQKESIQEWIVVVLMRLSSSSSSDSDVQVYATTMLAQLGLNTGSQEPPIFQTCREKDISSYPLRVDPTVFATPSLLDRAQNKPDVEGHLRQVIKQRLKEEVKSVYISPQAKAGLRASDSSRFPLMDKVTEFLESDQKVFLLLGDSGAGKSTFSRALECDLWKRYNRGGIIPLHINLPAIDKPEQDMVSKQLRRLEFTEPQIRELKVHRKFILICDGYDESQQTHNLYMSNRLNQPGEWNAKMVITCRSEYVGADYRDRFQPGDRNRSSETSAFQEAVITPFSTKQVHEYVDQYVTIHQLIWEAKEYKEALDRIPSLKELLTNPFLMSLSLEVLPRMMDPGKGLSENRITKVTLYDHFIEHWLERGKKRLGEKELTPQARSTFESLCDEGFTKNGIAFMKRLAVAIYKEQDGYPIIEYSRYKDEGTWKAEFFIGEDKQLLREASPLTRHGNHHRFIHRSILEYGLARAIFDPQDWKEEAPSQSSKDRRGSTSSVLSFETHNTIGRTAIATDNGPDVESPLMLRSYVNDSSILLFLEGRVQQEPMFKQQLLDYIEHSKNDKKWRTAAANAITILVRAGMEFRFSDLRGIQIPGADLSGGVFESAQLQGADLRKVNLRNVYLQNSDLSGSHMSGVQFGELPYLEQPDRVVTCKLSPDGSSFAILLANRNIVTYAISSWERNLMLKGGDFRIDCLAYSPDGQKIVLCSEGTSVRLLDVKTGDVRTVVDGKRLREEIWPFFDIIKTGGIAYSPQGNQIAYCILGQNEVRLYDLQTGGYRQTLEHYGSTSVACSPQGNVIGSASKDRTVRLWDEGTGKCLHILTGHTDGVECLVFSPNSNQIASGSWDNTVRLWDVESGACLLTLSGHSGGVIDIVYSSRGDQIATGSDDKSVRLWDIDSGECRQTLTGHRKEVTGVLYLPEGNLVASVSYDRTLRLWDVGSGSSRGVSNGHLRDVTSVMRSPKGHQIASRSLDGTIRLWDVDTGVCQHTLNGHKLPNPWRTFCNALPVVSIAYSPCGDLLVSSGEDGTIRLWDVTRGKCRRIMTSHGEKLNSVAFSPQGHQIASDSSDKTIRLWDVETGTCSHILTGHSSDINAVIYSPQGFQVASCSEDKTVRLWDTSSGECQHILAGHKGEVISIAYSPQGNQIVSGSDDDTARLWDVVTGECVQVFDHMGGFLRFSPQGNQIALSKRGEVMLWDVKTGEHYHLLENENMADIVYSPGGDLIACVCSNKVSLWDTKTDKRHLAFRLEPDVDWGMQRRGFEYRDITEWISSDADYLCTGGFDGSVRMWKVIKNGDKYSVHMHWRSTTGHLTVENACIQDVQGLSHLNKQLLNQRGAVDDPVHFSPEESEVESETPMEDWIPAENKVEKSLVHQELVYLSSLTSQSDQPKSRTRRNPASQDRRDNRSTR